MHEILGWLFGLKNVEKLRVGPPGFAADWAQGSGRFWVFFGVVLLLVIAYFFYFKFQTRGGRGARFLLATCRGLLLALVFVTLADPYIPLYSESSSEPLLYVLFDGTESMQIEDEMPEAQREALASAVGMPAAQSKVPHTRLDYVKALVGRDDEKNPLRRLRDEKKYRVEAFVFEGSSANQLRRVALAERGDSLKPAHLAQQLSAAGQVTAIGTALDELDQQLGKGNLAGVVMFSDYGLNGGLPPFGESSPAKRLGVPIHTVGVGATGVINLSIEVSPDVKMKKTELSEVNVRWEQSGLDGKQATVRVIGQWQDGAAQGQEVEIGEKTIPLNGSLGSVTLPFTPQEAGRILFRAEADPQDGEKVVDDNRSEQFGNVIDDYLRLMYVAYEPDWEWRFIKEVFHRDKLVGIKGFRTYLRSSDPKVRQSNDLFLPTLTPKRSEFFAHDIIFLGDMPGEALSQRFCEMTEEFVRDFGGGLVVIAGPRFGPGELAGTPLEKMLPVQLDPQRGIADKREFELRLTPLGEAEDFMQLGDPEKNEDNLAESIMAWRNLGALQWYQPVKNPQPGATVLAEHPTDMGEGNEAKQPLIAIQKYGKGEVVFIAFNETWRMRKRYGEKYYRQFWSQMMNRLALSHALGDQKRFVVRTDRDSYNVDDFVTLIVEAYDKDWKPLRPENLPAGKLTAELFSPGDAVGRTVPLSRLRDGQYEARIAADVAGEWRVRIKDPVEEATREVRVNVASLSIERRKAHRDKDVQDRIAADSGGESYELTQVNDLIDNLNFQPQINSSEKRERLWATPLWLIAVVGLMIGEWFTRKMLNMA